MKNKKLIPVEGDTQLCRDPHSNAILNTSTQEYSAYLRLKDQKMREIEESKIKMGEIDKLKSEVSEIKDMMKYIVSKLDDK